MRISDWSSDVCSSDLPRFSAIIELRAHGAKPRLRDAVRRAAVRGDEAAPPQPVEQRQAGVRKNVAVAGEAQRLHDMAGFAAPMADHADRKSTRLNSSH